MLRGIRNFAAFAPVWRRHFVMGLVIGLMFMSAVGIAIGAAARQQTFSSPDEGVQALINAAKNNDTASLLQVLGPEAQSFINTGDPVSDRASRGRFVQAYEEAHTLVQSGDTQVILQVGKDPWPFPIPLVKDNTSWRFDSKDGQGGDPQSAHRTQRTRRHPGVPGLCRRATRILHAQPTTRCAAPVCHKVHEHEGQT